VILIRSMNQQFYCLPAVPKILCIFHNHFFPFVTPAHYFDPWNRSSDYSTGRHTPAPPGFSRQAMKLRGR
jgi:hypothetical protein